jgi:hypothetical protein
MDPLMFAAAPTKLHDDFHHLVGSQRAEQL